MVCFSRLSRITHTYESLVLIFQVRILFSPHDKPWPYHRVTFPLPMANEPRIHDPRFQRYNAHRFQMLYIIICVLCTWYSSIQFDSSIFFIHIHHFCGHMQTAPRIDCSPSPLDLFHQSPVIFHAQVEDVPSSLSYERPSKLDTRPNYET